jgi:hypothetical protein
MSRFLRINAQDSRLVQVFFLVIERDQFQC